MNQHNTVIFTSMLFFCSLFLFTFGLANQEIVAFDTRFYLFAVEMWRHGVTLFPTTYAVPYPDYPVTSTLLIHASAHVFGGLSKFTVVLPTAIAASLIVVFTFLIGNIHNKSYGFSAVCLLFLTVGFLKSARSLALDLYPTLVVTAAFYCLYSADYLRQPHRHYWLPILFIFGFALRGPIGLVMPAGVACVYYAIQCRFKKMFMVGLSAGLLLSVCMFLLLYLANQAGGSQFVNDVLRMQVLGRLGDNALPFLFYFTNSVSEYALSFPLALMVIMATCLFPQARKYLRAHPEKKQLFLQLCGWFFVIMIGMSIPGGKKIRYILPMVPAACLLAAFTLSFGYLPRLKKCLLFFFFLMPAVFFVALLLVQKRLVDFTLSLHLIFFMLMLFQTTMCFVAKYKPHLILLVATITFYCVTLFVIEPVELHIERGRDFVQRVEALRGDAPLVFYRESPDGLPIKYLINMPKESDIYFIDTEDGLLNDTRHAYFITHQPYFDALPVGVKKQFRVIEKTQFAHTAVVVFVKN